MRNHKSVRDEVTIDLQRTSLKSLTPRTSTWGQVTYPVAGFFGGNGTGKSALLDAILYAFSAIKFSATSWQAASEMQRAPFLLDRDSADQPSTYILQFVHDGRRHEYGFAVDAQGIREEWLRDVPRTRWRTLIQRDRYEGRLLLHASIRPRISVADRELLLSRAGLLPAHPLNAIARDLVEHFDVVLVKDSHRAARLAAIADSLAEHTISLEDLAALLAAADIGVTGVEVEETALPEWIRRAFLRFQHDIVEERERASTGQAPAEAHQAGERSVSTPTLNDEALTQVVRHLLFTHRASTPDAPPFSIEDESDGTVAWLAIAVPALETLRRGGLLIVDEIDASLHPHLLDLVLSAFATPQINRHHAQLIFTSRESYVLSSLSEISLEPEQVWFTDKLLDGATKVVSLADFPRHRDANVAKRYLTGRYGGVPRLSPALFAALVDDEAAEDDDETGHADA